MPQSSKKSKQPAHTKIVATLGPATSSRDMIRKLVQAGVDVFRINTAHGTRKDHATALTHVRSVEDELARPTGVLLDLAGPKIRLGELPGDMLSCGFGETYHFVRQPSGQERELTTTYDRLVDELDPGDTVMLADGLVAMVVIDKQADRVTCEVVQAGAIRSRQGVNLPGVKLSIPALTDKDREHAVWAAKQGIDFVGMSFIRRAEEVRELKSLLREAGGRAHVVAKIEKREALENLDEIIQAADAVMVARGDLGVETDVATVALTQKRIIDACNFQEKPVITATQMLESMHHSQRPTRAETTDVANAILDGTDACMLSGETAIGEYPLDAVKMMKRIALVTEEAVRIQAVRPYRHQKDDEITKVTHAVVYGAGEIARNLDPALMIVASHSGKTARAISKRRLTVGIAGISDDPVVLRRMSLYWGVLPVMGIPAERASKVLLHTEAWALEHNLVESGDRVVFVCGSNLLPVVQNTVIVHEVGTPTGAEGISP